MKHRVLVVGCGQMGSSHARAYHKRSDCEIVGLVSRGESRERLSHELGGLPTFDSFEKALEATAPSCVSINTYPDTHAPFALLALQAGAHVFVEKPLGTTVEEARAVVDAVGDRKVVVGYILRHHPSWQRFVELAKGLGKPLVMRLNLNQQSVGAAWEIHKKLMESVSPIVDCGVHYVDVMCQMTGAKPVSVNAMGARLSDEIAPQMQNYGQLQVVFDDGSVGWYEVGWGPMMSETAHFVKDVIGPQGSVSMRKKGGGSAHLEGHTATEELLVHTLAGDQVIDTADEPSHQELCDREQAFFLDAIEQDLDLSDHLRDVLSSQEIVLAADAQVRKGLEF